MTDVYTAHRARVAAAAAETHAVAAALKPFGINPSEFAVLQAIADSPLPVSHAGRVVGVTTGGMTKLADQLAAAGLAVKVRPPGDRRVVLVDFTPSGEGLFFAADRAVTDALARMGTA